MKRAFFWLVLLSLASALLAGCGASGQAGQDAGDGQAGRDAAVRAGASPEVVDPQEADSQSKAAGETPSILGSTPEAGQVGSWERRKLWDAWDMGYPDGWQVEESGGVVILTGAYGEQRYRVEMAQPENVEGDELAVWAKADLDALNQPDAELVRLSTTDVQAMKASNLTLAGSEAGACPSVRAYGQGRTGETLHRIIVTVTQVGGGECEAINSERLADALMAEARL